MKKIPKFLEDLKKQTIITADRGRLYIRPQNEKLAKLQEVQKASKISAQKLMECAIDLLHEKFTKERKAG